MLLKQAYYSYMYVTKDVGAKDAAPSTDLTEGNYWETENNYLVLVYYRAMGDRYDQLVGLVMLNSRLNRR
jgi:thiamine pyrophosphokinase